MNELLSVNDLVVTCGEKKILRGVNFSVERGEILIIVGESGSGKSTILKAIDGLLGKNFSVDGKIFFDGRDITHLSDNERRKISGEIVQNIYSDLENLGFNGGTILKPY